MRRASTVKAIREKSRDCHLTWFGVRSTDAASFTEYSDTISYLGLISPFNQNDRDECSLEALSGHRVYLNTYNFDIDTSPEAERLIDKLKSCAGKNSALLSYRPCRRLHTAAKALGYNCLEVEPTFFSSLNNKFNNEQEMRKIGVPTIDYFKIQATDDPRLRAILDKGPIIVRSDFSAGGINLWLVSSCDELSALLATKSEEMASLSFAPYLTPSIPLNIGACVNRDMSCSLHTLSAQLIGNPLLTKQPFGYCGNDFSVPRSFDRAIIAQCAEITRKIACWLHKKGFIGAFGVDLLLCGDQVFFVELNPRLQGSSPFSARLDIERNDIDIFTAHLAAWLDIDTGNITETEEFIDRTREQPAKANIYFQNLGDSDIYVSPLPASQWQIYMTPEPTITVAPLGACFCAWASHQVTTNGSDLTPQAESEIKRMITTSLL